MENIDHTRTKVKHPQTKGICERFHRTILDEFYRVTFRKKLYASVAELQADLDAWVKEYNEERPPQGSLPRVRALLQNACATACGSVWRFPALALWLW